MVAKKKNEDYGIASNADPEDGDGGADDSTETVNLIADAFKYTETSFDKKSFLAYIKGYLARIIKHLTEKNPSRVDQFKKDAQAFIMSMQSSFDDYNFYLGESCDADAMVVIQKFDEDGMTPIMYYFKDGLKETKV